MEGYNASGSKTVRVAALLFFLICVPLSLWESSVLAKIFVVQNPVATANNLLTHEFIFRASIVSHLIGTVVFLIMVMMFYRLFRQTESHLARLMIVPVLAQLPIVFVLEAINYTALLTLKGEPRPTFDVAQQQEVAYFLLRFHRYAFGADKIIFGLLFIPFGMLVYRFGYAPRVIGILIIIGGVGYVADTCLYIILQRPDYLKIQSLKLYSSASYSLAFLWFLIKGARQPNTLT